MSQLLRATLWILLHSLFRVRIVGGQHLPAAGGGVIVANHLSYVDAFLIGAATPRAIRFLLWKAIYDKPALRPFFRSLKAIPIDLDSRREAVAALVRAAREVEAGELVGIFPEGEITRTGETMPFKRGYERLAASGAPLIPVWLGGLWGHPLSMKGGKLFASRERWFRPNVTVIIGEPIYGAISPQDLRERVMALNPL